MFVDEMAPSFMKKNNSYSHCPLKKRPVLVVVPDEVPDIIKDEIIDVVTDNPSEPENLSTKPEDLSKTAEKSRMLRSPVKLPRLRSPQSASLTNHLTPIQPVATLHYLPKPITPPLETASFHQNIKKEYVKVIHHDDGSIHFLPTKPSMEPLNLNTPVEPVAHYGTSAWARSPQMYSSHYLPYSTAYGFSGTELYSSYPMVTYPHSPEEASPSPLNPTHPCSTVQRPIARNYWSSSTSPEHCTLSPSNFLGYGSLRSPPSVTPEDLSSPGSDSGRSSAGSTSAGPTILMKIESATPLSSPNTPSSAAPRYQCPNCGKSYSTYSGLSKHQQFHCAAAESQSKKSFSCKYCEKVYISLGALKMHIRTHTLPCKCHLCGKAFSRPWLLQGHIRTHTGEKPFSCQHCNRAFADRSNLRAHLQTHSDVKKYSCNSCSKTFSRMSLLTKHQESGCPGNSMGYG